MTLPAPEEKARVVREMFDRIAPSYDAMNVLMTGGLDRIWRWRLIRACRIQAGDLVVDLGCGTGDLIELAARAGGRPVGVDPAGGMLAIARQRGMGATVVQGDAAAIPLADGSVQVVISAFALRNFLAIPPVFAEAARVLAPCGRLALLEVAEPRIALIRALHGFYFRRVVPAIGGLFSDREAYRYLPESTSYLPVPEELCAMLAAAGFTRIQRVSLGAGAVQLLSAELAPASAGTSATDARARTSGEEPASAGGGQ